MTCEICRGARYVRLPRYRQASIRYEATVPTSEPIQRSYLEIGCPECGKGEETDIVHVSTVGAECSFDSRYEDADQIRNHVRENVADKIAHELLRAGFISFAEEKGKDRYFETITARGTLGVVAPEVVKTIERRATDKMTDFLGDVASTAAAAINVWGAHYGQQDISKEMAIRFMREAFAKHLEKVSK